MDPTWGGGFQRSSDPLAGVEGAAKPVLKNLTAALGHKRLGFPAETPPTVCLFDKFTSAQQLRQCQRWVTIIQRQ